MPITIQRFDADAIRAYQAGLVDLLRDVVDHGASVNFLAPLDRAEAAAFWEKVADALSAGERSLIAALDGDQVVGSAQLVLATQSNGRHRAEVQKVFVHSERAVRGSA